MMMKFGLVLCVTLLMIFAAPVQAGERIEYQDGAIVLEGYLAKPDASQYPGKRPAVLVIHQWKGLGDYEKGRADMLAALGYVAFAVDMYGKGIRPTTAAEAGQEATKYKSDAVLARARIAAALRTVREFKDVDVDKVAAIGYCFGGTMGLELARSGADVKGVVAFHAGLATPAPAKSGVVKASALVHHGAVDPLVKPKEVAAFRNEMNNAGADWHLVEYANAVHSFTEKAAGDDPSKGAAYNAAADLRSWAYTTDFLEEIF